MLADADMTTAAALAAKDFSSLWLPGERVCPCRPVWGLSVLLPIKVCVCVCVWSLMSLGLMGSVN